MKTVRLVSLLTIVCLSAQLFSGCTSSKPMMAGRTRDQVMKSIHPGDIITIYSRDNSIDNIVVASVTEHEIIGNGMVFKYDEIAEIYKKTNTTWGSPAEEGCIWAVICLIPWANGGFCL